MTIEQIKTATLEQLYNRCPEKDVRKKERRLIKRQIQRIEKENEEKTHYAKQL